MTALAGTAIVLLAGLTLYLARRISRRQKRAPRLREEAVKPFERPPEPGDLTAIGRLLHDANERAGAVEIRLQPLVLDIAAGRLRARGIDIDRDAASMGETLGEPLAQLLRPDELRFADRRAPGLAVDELQRLVEELEAL